MTSIQIDAASVKNVSNIFRLTEEESSKALSSAVKETKTWAVSQYTKIMGASTGLTSQFLRGSKAKGIKPRIVSYFKRTTSRLYFGVLPMNVIRFKPKAYPSKARGRTFLNGGLRTRIGDFPGAFITTMYNKKGQAYQTVFKRTGSYTRKSTGKELNTQGNYAGKRREMIAAVKAPLTPYAKVSLKVIEPQILEMFWNKLIQKMKI